MSSSRPMKILVLMASVACGAYGQELKWVQMPSKECWPQARQSHSSALIAADIWTFGGWNGTSLFNDMWRYSIQGGSWTHLPRSASWPSARVEFSMVADAAGKQLFLFGGLAVYWDGGENEYFKDLWKFQIEELKWTELELLEPVPQAREAHSAVLDSEGKMWIFAGRNVSPNRLGDMWRCDVQAEVPSCIQINRTDPWPAARDHHEAVMDADDCMWVFGGSGSAGELLDELWKFSTKAQSWTQLSKEGQPWPAARGNHALLLNARIPTLELFLFGGHDGRGSLFNDLWKFDLKAQRWEELHPSGGYPLERYGHSADLDEFGRLWIFAGRAGSGASSALWLIEVQEVPQAELVASVMPAFVGIHTISALVLAWLWYRWQPGADPPRQDGTAQAAASTMGRQRMMDSE